FAEKKGPHNAALFALLELSNKFVPVRQIVGSHFSAMGEVNFQTVLPAVAAKIGENDSVELWMLAFARCGVVLAKVVVMTPETTSSSSTNLPVIDVLRARPAEVLVNGAWPTLL